MCLYVFICGEARLTETVLGVTKPFSLGKPDSIVLVVPKTVRERVKIRPGQLWHVKVDKQGRIIYEKVEEEEVTNGS